MLATSRSATRLTLLTGIAFAMLMMFSKVFFYRPLLGMPGGKTFVFEAAGLLIAYAVVVLWTTDRDSPVRHNMLLATPLGLIGGFIQIASMMQEEFKDLGPRWNGIVGFSLLFCTFTAWGIAGFRTARRTGDVRSGAMAGLWCAVITMSMVVLFGFIVELYLAVPRPEYVATWGEFKRSGWTDIRAFTIANTLDSAFSHLFMGPVLGAMLGSGASLIARFQLNRQSDAA
jgi:hypothetical protein